MNETSLSEYDLDKIALGEEAGLVFSGDWDEETNMPVFVGTDEQFMVYEVLKLYSQDDMIEEAEDYMKEWCGEPQDLPYLINETRNPDERTTLFIEFCEYLNDK